MSGMVVMPLELDVFGNELSDKLDPFEMSPNRTFSEDVPTRSPRSPVGPAATISVEMRAELDAEGAELWNQASNRAESIITKWFSDVRGMTDEKKEWLRKVPTRHALAFCSSLAPDRTARHAQWRLTYRCPPVLQAADATRKAAMTSAAEHNAFEAEKMAAREVRHRLCHALPLPSRLRHRPCHALPLPSRLRHCHPLRSAHAGRAPRERRGPGPFQRHVSLSLVSRHLRLPACAAPWGRAF